MTGLGTGHVGPADTLSEKSLSVSDEIMPAFTYGRFYKSITQDCHKLCLSKLPSDQTDKSFLLVQAAIFSIRVF